MHILKVETFSGNYSDTSFYSISFNKIKNKKPPAASFSKKKCLRNILLIFFWPNIPINHPQQHEEAKIDLSYLFVGPGVSRNLGWGNPLKFEIHCLILVTSTSAKSVSVNIKGTHTVYLSSSLYIINQKPMIPRIHFHYITTWVARSSG